MAVDFFDDAICVTGARVEEFINVPATVERMRPVCSAKWVTTDDECVSERGLLEVISPQRHKGHEEKICVVMLREIIDKTATCGAWCHDTA